MRELYHIQNLNFISYIDFVKACKDGIKSVPNHMNLEQVQQMRSPGNVMYYDFISYFIAPVIGKMEYKKKSCSHLLSNYTTVSDEAFAILCYENNIDTWMDMGLTNNTKTSNVPRKYTNGGKSQRKIATSQHNKGWSDEGLRRFNKLFDLVEKNRETPFAKEFEENFCIWEEKKAEKKRKKAEKLLLEVVEMRHELWSDDEDEGTAQENTNDSNKKANTLVTPAKNHKQHTTAKESSGSEEESEDEAAAPIKDTAVIRGN